MGRKTCTAFLALIGAAWFNTAACGGVATTPADRNGDDGTKIGQRRTSVVDELTPTTFVEHVRNIANGSHAVSIVPVVMFHMPWCEHCKMTMPELEEAAHRVGKSFEQRHEEQPLLVPKFYTLSCAEPGAEMICQQHAGTSYPSILAFREQRSIKFNRPRVANVITWWVFRVTRPAVLMLDSTDMWDATSRQEVSFLLQLPLDLSLGSTLFRHWESIALDHIEQHSFFVTSSNTNLAKRLGPAPSVHVRGPSSLGLQPLPFSRQIDREALKAWVSINQFPPVVVLGPYTFMDVRAAEITVVTLVHGTSGTDLKVLDGFRAKAARLRADGRYLFASLNASDEDNKHLLDYKFPLLSPSLNTQPRVFAFVTIGGQTQYWEDPSFVSVDDLSLEAMDRLLQDAEAMQDESVASWFKEKRKRYVRFAALSMSTSTVAILIPIVLFYLICRFCQVLWYALFVGEMGAPQSTSHPHVD